MIVKVTGTAAKPGSDAVKFTVVGPATCPAAIGNVAEVAPDGMTMPAGTGAAGVSLVRVTTMPPRKAGLVRVTVPVNVWPLDHVWVFDTKGITRDWIEGEGEAVTEIVLPLENPFAVAVTVPVVNTATGKVLQVKAARYAPGKSEMDAGRIRAGLVLVRVIVAGTYATAERKTYPVPEAPPWTDVKPFCELPKVTELGLETEATVRVPCVTTLPVAPCKTTGTGWKSGAGLVVMVTDAVVWPAGTTRLAGVGNSAVLELEKFTRAPAGGAGAVKET
jgi:hypothetical protein